MEEHSNIPESNDGWKHKPSSRILLVLRVLVPTKLTQPSYTGQLYHAGKLSQWTSVYPHKN